MVTMREYLNALAEGLGESSYVDAVYTRNSDIYPHTIIVDDDIEIELAKDCPMPPAILQNCNIFMTCYARKCEHWSIRKEKIVHVHKHVDSDADRELIETLLQKEEHLAHAKCGVDDIEAEIEKTLYGELKND